MWSQALFAHHKSAFQAIRIHILIYKIISHLPGNHVVYFKVFLSGSVRRKLWSRENKSIHAKKNLLKLYLIGQQWWKMLSQLHTIPFKALFVFVLLIFFHKAPQSSASSLFSSPWLFSLHQPSCDSWELWPFKEKPSRAATAVCMCVCVCRFAWCSNELQLKNESVLLSLCVLDISLFLIYI